MIKDANGDELVYWPITGLTEGEDSEVLDFTVEVPSADSVLSATLDSRCIVWAKKVGDVSFINISATPYDLSGLSGDEDFQCYVEALTPIVGLERVPVTVSTSVSYPAGWLV